MKLFTTLLAIFLSASIFSCISILKRNVRPNYKIIDHKGVLPGVNIPNIIKDALSIPTSKLSKKYFPDSYVFIANQKGRNLDGLITWSRNFEVQTEVSKRIQTNVDIAATKITEGNKDEITSIMEVVTKILSKQKISGLKMEQDWWIKLQYEDGMEEYQYAIVYSIEKKMLDKFIQDAVNEADRERELKADKAPIIDKLREELDTTAYGLENKDNPLLSAEVF